MNEQQDISDHVFHVVKGHVSPQLLATSSTVYTAFISIYRCQSLDAP